MKFQIKDLVSKDASPISRRCWTDQSVYPNRWFLWSNASFQVSLPRGPGKVECWCWAVVPADAPDTIKRVEGAYKINSWSENPPARTRRIIGNVELMAHAEEEYSVLRNFHLYSARPGSASFLHSGQRRDLLLATEAGYKLKQPEVILDYAQPAVPNVSGGVAAYASDALQADQLWRLSENLVGHAFCPG